MKNFVEITPVLATGVEVIVGHNTQILYQGPLDTRLEFEIDHCETNNVFWIDNHSHVDIELDTVAMFEQGHDKLRYMGVFQHQDGIPAWPSHWVHAHGRWSISYEYPVFSWLHQKLQYGWLVKPAEVNNQ